MIAVQTDRHLFALYYEALDIIPREPLKRITVSDPELLHRITSVLRCKEGDYCILFNKTHSVICLVERIEKHRVVVRCKEIKEHQPLHPLVGTLVPLLKKEAFEETISFMTSLGVHYIQPIITEKVQKQWLMAKDMERLHRIMIAAAEQSKQFILPHLRSPLSLSQALLELMPPAQKVFFDADGMPIATFLSQATAASPFVCLIGPEGDLTSAEKELLHQYNFIFCTLTPSILRAEQALGLGVGIIRSWFNS